MHFKAETLGPGTHHPATSFPWGSLLCPISLSPGCRGKVPQPAKVLSGSANPAQGLAMICLGLLALGYRACKWICCGKSSMGLGAPWPLSCSLEETFLASMLETALLPQQVPFRQHVHQEAPKMGAMEQIPSQTKSVERVKPKYFTSQPPVCQPCSLFITDS